MKKAILVFSIFLLFFSFKPWLTPEVFAKITSELWIENKDQSTKIFVTVVPIGSVMNGNKVISPICKYPYIPIYEYINGGSKILDKYETLNGNSLFLLNHDAFSVNITDAAIGYGLYKISVYKVREDESIEETLTASCLVDFTDSDYGTIEWPSGFTNVIGLSYNNGLLYLDWNQKQTPPVIKIWDQRVRGPALLKKQNKDGFVFLN
jgi:hypothetical protein